MSNLFGIEIFEGNKEAFIRLLKFYITTESKKFIVTANPEIIMRGYKCSSYKEILNKADHVIPDGIGIVKALQLFRKPVSQRITGIDTMMELLEYSNENSLKLYFLGASEESISKMISNVKTGYPNIQIGGFHHGFFQDDQEILEEMKDIQPDLVFVAMGVPRQEEWIYKNLEHFDKGIFIGVGGSFDVLSGIQKRAPKFMQDLHLEWLYRIISNPKKLGKLKSLYEFSSLVFIEYLKNRGFIKSTQINDDENRKI